MIEDIFPLRKHSSFANTLYSASFSSSLHPLLTQLNYSSYTQIWLETKLVVWGGEILDLLNFCILTNFLVLHVCAHLLCICIIFLRFTLLGVHTSVP